MNEPYGDHQQEIVIIGQQMDNELITNALNQCLLSDDDMRKGLDAWRDIEDPFSEAWETAIKALAHGMKVIITPTIMTMDITIELILRPCYRIHSKLRIKLFQLVMYDYVLYV